MATLFNSQLSTFLPREDFFSEGETSLSNNCLDDSDLPNSSSISATSSNSPKSNRSSILTRSCSSVPLSQPSNDTIISRYRGLIERKTIPGIKSIEQLTKWNSKDRETVIGCVFGVVKSVRDSRGTKFKYVTLVDPTHEPGIELETFGMQEKIAVGQMMKCLNLKAQRTGSTVAFMFTPSTKTAFFPLFSYNYDNPMGDERNKALTETRFSFPEDREICYLLEKWFSLKILNGTKLSNLPKPGEFVDICCQVLAFNKSPLSMNAVIWDTTTPNYKPLFGSDGRPPLGLECINYDYFHVAYEKYFSLTVWKEESYDQAQHYDTFRCIDLTTGDDLVVLFNLQVVEDTNHPGKSSLVMRSSRKWGKAVRLCHWNSILGRLFLHQCQEYRKDFRRKLGLIDSSEVEKPKQLKSPAKQTPSKPTRTSTNPNQDPKINNTTRASLSQTNKRDSLQSNNHYDLRPNATIEIRKQVNQESRLNIQESISDLDASKAEESNPINNKDLNASQRSQKRKSPKKRKAETERLKEVLDDPVPSTSGYTLRSQRRIATASAQLNQQSTTNPTVNQSANVDLLTRLKNKAAKFLNWDKLLTNGLERLRLLHEVLEESDLRDEASTLTREEHIQYIQFAIDHLEKSQQSKSSPPPPPSISKPHVTINHRSSVIPNDSDSDMTDETFETFPIIDRVKYFTS